MEIQINAIHFDMTEKLHAFVNKKAEKLANHYPFVTNFEANMKVVKAETALNKEAKVILCVPQRDDLVATKVCDTFEEAIDTAIRALEPQLEKYKDKK